VVGFLRPQIVLPRWLLNAPPDQRRMALDHESQHIAAQDPLLLHIALLLTALAPWNLPLWWQLRRLRFAIEVDCDRRVLKSGAKAKDYGEMLLIVGQRQRALISGVLALTEKASQLERRIRIITGAAGRRTLLGFGGLLAVSISLAVAAQQIKVPNVILASNQPIPEDSATINGTIVDEAGQPAKNATVFVYSAHLKKGYAIVCPTCWIDCGKRAGTDGQGRFTITGLNPALRFRLLVVKDGFIATAKGGVDPTQGPLPPIKLNPRIASPDDSKIVHGRLSDATGNPISGALIEPVGAFQPGGMMFFGTVDWIDPLAATNASGEFAIVATKPVDKIMLKISPRALAPTIVSEPTGSATNFIVLTDGATITGWLVGPSGNPIANAELVMTSHDRVNGESFSDVRVGTDNDGSFAFTNVPARRVWGIYPTSESLQNQNLTADPYWCETLADRQVVNVGKITLRPGFSVSGKIDLVDKKDVPPGMHVSIGSEWTVNGRLTDIAPDGTFEFKSLAPGIYSLGVGVAGYTPTADTPRELLVERDRRDVIIHMARSSAVTGAMELLLPESENSHLNGER
jgi:hypothetical protein